MIILWNLATTANYYVNKLIII